MFDLARSNAIHLGIGEPDFQPPVHVREALRKAVEEGFNKYGPSAGLPKLREAIARRLQKYNPEITPDKIIVTAGATQALHTALFTVIEEGDEVLVPDPGFPLYPNEVRLAGGKPIFYPLLEENKYMPKIEELQATKRTKAIIVNSPSNPIGAVFDRRTIEALVEFAKEHKLIIFSDEVYDEILYDIEYTSFLGRYDRVVYINSFSKTYALTGWRIGYLVAEKVLLQEILKMHYYTVACPSTPVQYAALAALEGSQESVREMVAEFKKRRALMIKLLNQIKGFRCLTPGGAFYAFPSYKFKVASEKLAKQILEKNVVCVPGNAFGKRGEYHLRFSYANSLENIKKGLELVKEVIENYISRSPN
jgi:aspartate aminotransferase